MIEPRAGRKQRVGIEAKTSESGWALTGEKQVGRGEQVAHLGTAAGALEIDAFNRDAFVQLVIPACAVALEGIAAGRFDLGHCGAGRAKSGSRHRSRSVEGHRDHADVVKREHEFTIRHVGMVGRLERQPGLRAQAPGPRLQQGTAGKAAGQVSQVGRVGRVEKKAGPKSRHSLALWPEAWRPGPEAWSLRPAKPQACATRPAQGRPSSCRPAPESESRGRRAPL